VTRLLPAHVVALAAAIGLALGTVQRLEPPALALGIAAAMVVLLAGAPADTRLTLVALLVAALGWGWSSARLDALDRSPLSLLVGRGGHARLAVTAGARRGMFAQRLPARVLRFDGQGVGGERAELELPLGRSPPQGALIDALVVVRAPKGPSHGFDERTWLRRQGIHVVLRVDGWEQVGRRGGLGGAGDRLRGWLARGSAPGVAGERRAVLEGILLGDDARLTDSLKTSFQRSGLYHLLAVSGQNVVLLAAGVLGLAVLLGLPRWCGHTGALAAIVGYVLAVGPQPSVIRAAVSGGAVSVAWLLGRERDAWHVLLLAAIVLLAWNPYALFDAGFELSFAAVVAIFVLAPPLRAALDGYPGPGWLKAAVSISVACSVATAPLLWLQFGRVPMLGVVANALAEVAVGPLLGLAFVAAIVDPVAPPVADALAYVNGLLAAYIAACARLVGAVPVAQLTGRTAAVVSGVLLVAAAYAWRRWQQTTSSRPT
jgi:competence protein ComEC